ncbi:MAG: hypothetical protein AAF357_11500 [Verrucomicrobiota bacterium]
MSFFLRYCLVLGLLAGSQADGQNVSEQQLAAWLRKFPEADLNGDARLTLDEAIAYRQKLQSERTGKPQRQWGAPQDFEVDPGWDEAAFPDHAVSLRGPEEIRQIYAGIVGENDAVTSYPKPTDGSLRIIGTGHSFMRPGYDALNQIAKGLDSQQEIFTHIGGGITGSVRYKWEQENGIFQFEGEPRPKLLASLANADWDVMTWGPYFKDEPKYYRCWIDFALKYQPEMRFYLSDAWPQLYQLPSMPSSEAELTQEVFAKMNADREAAYNELIETLRGEYGERVFIMPTNRAFTLLAQRHIQSPLPGIDGLHRSVGKKPRSIWRDTLGHIGEGMERLEGYVFYATLYQKDPSELPKDLPFRDYGGFPSAGLDQVFREIAWQAVKAHPLSGVGVE